MSLALPLTGGQNLAVMVLWMLARHMGQRAPAAMMPLAQPWQVHCRGATGSQCGYRFPLQKPRLHKSVTFATQDSLTTCYV